MIKRFDAWRPSATWWVLGGVLIVMVVADVADLQKYNREIAILGTIGFVGMVLEMIAHARVAKIKEQTRG